MQRESGYFDKAPDTKPLLHLWSLGIEEQFYIIWPLLLWMAWKKRFNWLSITIAFAAVSFWLNIHSIHTNRTTAFCSPQTRFWELFIGTISAHLALHHKNAFLNARRKLDGWLGAIVYANAPETNGDTLRNAQSLLGAVLLCAGFRLITKDTYFPGAWALLPTLGAALLISAGSQA